MFARQLLFAFLVAGLSLVSSAKSFHWKATGSGNWADPERWDENDVPGAGDQVRIEYERAFATDADAVILGQIKEIVLGGDSSELVITNNSPLTLSFLFWGEGKTTKYGSGRLTLNADSNNQQVTTGRGLDVREGSLEFVSATSLTVSKPLGLFGDGTLAISSRVKELILGGLSGDGTVTNETVANTMLYLKGGTRAEPCVFAGKIDPTLKIQVNGGVYQFTNPEWAEKINSPAISDSTGASRMGFYRFPNSPIFRTPGAIDYLGEGGTWPTTSTLWLNNSSFNTEINGGLQGGLTMQGKVSLNSQYMMIINFAGDHTTPCVFDGSLHGGDITKIDGAAYVKKTGRGTWRFLDTAGRNTRANRGTVAVEQGTLEFQTIAERNSNCSLGTAACCHSEYSGSKDDTKAVPYAYLLGDGSSTNGAATATMKYIGTAVKTITNRLVAVKGEGRFAADTALVWTGFTSAQEGDNTLIFGGSAAGCVARGVTNGVGTLSVAKDGAGDWTVCATNGVKAAFAKEGVLKVDCTASQGYSWYRLKMKELQGTPPNRSGKTWTLYDLVLWNAQGKCSEDLVFNSSACGDNYLQLQPGQVTVNRSRALDADAVTKWFNEEGLDGTMSELSKTVLIEDESSWVVVTMRLPVGKENATRYDMSVFGTVVPERNPKSWSFEGSRDGLVWDELHQVTDLEQYPKVSRTWSSDQTKGGAWTSAQPVGFELATASAIECRSLAVGAAKGAALQCVGGVKANGLDFDASDEGGTVTGVTLVDEGTITIRNVPAGSDPRWVNRRLFLPHDFSAVADLDKASSWPVFIDGAENTKYAVKVTVSGLELVKKGLFLLVK